MHILVRSFCPSRADLVFSFFNNVFLEGSCRAAVERHVELCRETLSATSAGYLGQTSRGAKTPGNWCHTSVKVNGTNPKKWFKKRARHEAMGGVPSTFQVGISFDILTILPLKHLSYLLEGRSFHLPNFGSTKGSNVVECMPSWTHLMHFEAALAWKTWLFRKWGYFTVAFCPLIFWFALAILGHCTHQLQRTADLRKWVEKSSTRALLHARHLVGRSQYIQSLSPIVNDSQHHEPPKVPLNRHEHWYFELQGLL